MVAWIRRPGNSLETIDRLGGPECPRFFARAIDLDFDFFFLLYCRTRAQGCSSQFAHHPAGFSGISELSADASDFRQLWLDADRRSFLQAAKAAVQLQTRRRKLFAGTRVRPQRHRPDR